MMGMIYSCPMNNLNYPELEGYESTNLQYFFPTVCKNLKITVYTLYICLQSIVSENITVSVFQIKEQLQYLHVFLCYIHRVECELCYIHRLECELDSSNA